MTVFSGIMVYVITWWMIFFCFLPMGIKPNPSLGDGAMPGAPEAPLLKKKVIITTIVSTVVFGVIDLLIRSDIISFRAIAEKMVM